tara:strand:+ start:1268 stop:1429 length:162 start_codon:yes stop_codon:yes gene_type:complete
MEVGVEQLTLRVKNLKPSGFQSVDKRNPDRSNIVGAMFNGEVTGIKHRKQLFS